MIHLLAASRGIGNSPEPEFTPVREPTPKPERSLREELKATINAMIDELSDSDLERIRAKKNFDWLSDGVNQHLTRVKNHSCK
jgi:hypothetical protein